MPQEGYPNLLTGKELNARLTPEQRHDNAVEAGKESGRARSVAAIVRKVMDEPAVKDGEVTRLEVYVRKVISASYDHPSVDDLAKMQKIMGEETTTLNMTGLAPVINIVKPGRDAGKGDDIE